MITVLLVLGLEVLDGKENGRGNGDSVWRRHEAGQTLNIVLGEPFYDGRQNDQACNNEIKVKNGHYKDVFANPKSTGKCGSLEGNIKSFHLHSPCRGPVASPTDFLNTLA